MEGDTCRELPAAAEVLRSEPYDAGVEIAVASYRFEPVLAKGVRLNTLRKAEGPARVYEMEAYREGNRSDAH